MDLCVRNKRSISYHGADHAADVDGVTASGDIASRVFTMFEVKVQNPQTNVHHVVLKLEEGRAF